MTGKPISQQHPSRRAPNPRRERSDEGSANRKDVWSRSGSRYRVRAIVLLGLNVLLFAGVCSFAFWLRSGERFAPIQEGYGDLLKQTFLSVRIIGYSGVSLGSLLLDPISVQQVPWQIPVLGLLMAALVAIPILVSILYRFWSSVPFIALVAFLAVMPWLAITLLGSCVIASLRPFRHRYRFMSALLGLLPAVVYLVLAWSGTTEAVVGKIDPVDRIKFVVPWVLAVVAATLAFALVLIIAKVVDYRPGAIAPLLAIMLGLPVALFEFYVGRDELYYRLLESANESHFSDVDASVSLEQAVADAWLRRPPPRGSLDAVREIVETQWLYELTSELRPFESALSSYQGELTSRCDWFLRYFPDSRYAANALYIKARALDMRIDPAAFRREKWIRYFDDFPSVASWHPWRMILANHPGGLLGAAARLRLAQLEARQGHIDRALNKLKTLVQRFDTRSENEMRLAQANPTTNVLTREPPEATLRISKEHILLEGRRLLELLQANNDPLWGYEPLSGPRHASDSFRFGLLDLVPEDPQYLTNLETLKQQYPNCQIEDNIDLERAKATLSSARKIELLEACLRRFPERDAAPEALFRLAVAYKQDGRSSLSDKAFTRLNREYPHSLWAREASSYLPWLSQTRVSEGRQ